MAVESVGDVCVPAFLPLLYDSREISLSINYNAGI